VTDNNDVSDERQAFIEELKKVVFKYRDIVEPNDMIYDLSELVSEIEMNDEGEEDPDTIEPKE